MKRRDFLKTAVVGSVGLSTASLQAGTTHQPTDNRKVSTETFPEKQPLITYSDRPPLLESPRGVFTSAITPNDLFFVRWHLPDIPTHIDPNTYTIKVDGLVDKSFEVSLNDLKHKFEQVEVTSVLQCGGNSRSAFTPVAGGIQWGSGAMGCAKWKGVRLSDVLKKAGVKKEAHWIGFNGSEKAAYYETPDFVRELHIDELDDNVILAYEMNGEDLPYLNGYPLRLIIPGYYSDSWVKMLSHITITKDYKKLFFMDKAYRIADNETESETPDNLAPKTKPISKMNVKSIIGYPLNGAILNRKSQVVVRGVAWDSGDGIADVMVSLDGGKTWKKSLLDNGKEGRYAYRAFRFGFKPMKMGKLNIMAKAITKLGKEQPLDKDVLWNRGGYKYNGVDTVSVEII